MTLVEEADVIVPDIVEVPLEGVPAEFPPEEEDPPPDEEELPPDEEPPPGAEEER